MQWPVCHSENEEASTEFKDKVRRMKRTEINRKVPEEDTEPKTLSISREEMLGRVFISFEQIILWLMSSFWAGSCGAGGFQKISELRKATVEMMGIVQPALEGENAEREAGTSNGHHHWWPQSLNPSLTPELLKEHLLQGFAPLVKVTHLCVWYQDCL